MTLPISRDGLRLAALVLICYATTSRLGSYESVGLLLLFAAIALMLISQFTARATPVGRPAWAVAVAALLLMVLQYPEHAPQIYDGHLVRPLVALAVTAALGVIVLRRRRRATTWLIGALALAQLAIVALALRRNWGGPPIDVFAVQQAASWALLHGANPYTLLIDQSVGNGLDPFTPIAAHYPYGPTVAILDLPARLLGDVRLTHLAAIAVLLAVMTALAHRGAPGRERLIAVLWLALPLSAGMVQNAWIDIITMAGFGGWLVLRDRHPRWAILILAIALAAKPIFLPALLPIFVWSKPGRLQIILSGVGAGLIVLPFAVATGFSAFYTYVVENHITGGPRFDSLTVTSYLHFMGRDALPLVVTAAIVLTVIMICVVHQPRDQGDLLTAGAVICTIGFIMLKQAFFNYYFIPATLLVMALATRQLAVDEGPAEPRQAGR